MTGPPSWVTALGARRPRTPLRTGPTAPFPEARVHPCVHPKWTQIGLEQFQALAAEVGTRFELACDGFASNNKHLGDTVGADMCSRSGAPMSTDRHRKAPLSTPCPRPCPPAKIENERVQNGLAEHVLLLASEHGPKALDEARELAESILADPIVERARTLLRLLDEGSPFAALRAVELAEQVDCEGAHNRRTGDSPRATETPRRSPSCQAHPCSSQRCR